jgi:DNA-binding NarL/FixJ family response regulator
MINILLADDHELMRRGIRGLLESRSDFAVCADVGDGEEAVEQALVNKPDVVVLDISMPKMNGLEAARRIRADLPDTQVLFYTVYDTPTLVRDVLDAGACGYILKSDAPTHLLAAVEATAQKNLYFSAGVSGSVIHPMAPTPAPEADLPEDIPLTNREREIASLLAIGKSNKEVARMLCISVRTVETHRRRILQKLGVNSLAELVLFAVRHRMVEL